MRLATRRALAGAALAAAYVVAARLGFELAVVAEQVTTVRAPPGVPDGAPLHGPVRLALRVWAGACVANVYARTKRWIAAAIAAASALAGVTLCLPLPLPDSGK